MVDSRTPEIAASDFVAMMSASPTCVIVHDAVTLNILWANPAACELLEFSLSELRPLKSVDMSSPAQEYNRAEARAWLHIAAERGKNQVEWHYRSKSGRVIPTDAVATRIELARGTAVMVQFRDIERGRSMERDLRLTTSYVAALARHTATMAIMLDNEGEIRYITDSLAQRLGVTSTSVASLLALRGTLRCEGAVVTWAEALERANPVVAVQLRIGSRDGVVWLEGSLERLRDEEEGLLLLHDATERVESEARQQHEAEQENYLARYNAMGDMAMAIAHELGQPLAAARNFLVGMRARANSLSARSAEPTPLRDQLVYGIEHTLKQIERASAIVAAARMFVGHQESIEQVVDLNEIVENCLHFIRLRAVPGWVQVEVQLDPEPVLVRCERVLTGQVILNLCFNAIDEMMQCPRDTRRIVLSTSRRDGQGRFGVDDHGRGLPRDPFVGAFTSKERGSGIGLALSYRIITRQHGSIWAERRPEGGSRFAFALPLAAPEVPGPAGPR
ncbi:ATP-binding protein [Nocardioides sp.]|uniref:sensor histidine kinase n=1 Tax=Nocardioides sp. TaxID=35761 RepID=UPI0039E6B321